MKENNKGSMIILTVIGIATLLVAVIGATFAYFTATIEYKTEPTPAVITSNTMVIEYATKNELNYTGAMPGRPEEDYEKFKDNKLRFTLTSHQNLVSETNYDVYLVIDKNGFQKPVGEGKTDELVYVMSQPDNTRNVSEGAIKNGTIGKAGTPNYNNTINGIEYKPETLTITKKDEITNLETSKDVVVGLIPSNINYPENTEEEDKIKIKVGSGVLASHESSDTWQLEVWLKETKDEQNYNQGKTLKAHIDIEITGAGLASNEYVTTTKKAS